MVDFTCFAKLVSRSWTVLALHRLTLIPEAAGDKADVLSLKSSKASSRAGANCNIRTAR